MYIHADESKRTKSDTPPVALLYASRVLYFYEYDRLTNR